MSRKLWIGSTDGKNYVISPNRADLPANCTPAPIHNPPTQHQLDILTRNGGSVLIWQDQRRDSGKASGRTSSKK